MNEREKLEMVKMCVDALLEGKKLEYGHDNGWGLSLASPCNVFINIMEYNHKYRIAKPTVKVRYRLYKFHNSTDAGVDQIYDPLKESATQKAIYFRGWIGDWQEVEIEE